ncbi:site-specific DNA-methyltransferase [Candidatus Pacearchaeota archaeon]|nr:site-specific DNA-methyltransferase [Candidatus Pacearchaeota archaeon]
MAKKNIIKSQKKLTEERSEVEQEINPQKEREELGKEKPRSKDTVRLIWASKPKKEPAAKDLDFQTAEEVYPNKEDIKSKDKKLNAFWSDTKDVSDDPNRIIWGDNLLVMKALLAKGYEGQIDLIYIDPPFNTGENFNFSNQVKIGDSTFDKELTMSERLAYTDTWKRGLDSFLDMMYPRLQLMRKLLSEKGSIFVHCDSNASHYIKIMMDEIFGKENFINEVIWRRTYAGKTISRNIPQNTDVILWFSKTKDYFFNPITTPLNDKDKESFNKNDNDGRGLYGTVSMQKVSGPTKGTSYDYVDNKGKVWNCPAKGWRMIHEKMKALENDNRLYFGGQTVREKYYLNERMEIGKQIDNLWLDIGNLNRNKSEILGYPTQKPTDLLDRIINMSCAKNGIVADFFAGSGTTGAVAEKNNRKWIMSDISKTAIQVIRSRLVNQGAKPFLIQNLGNYQRQLIYASEVNLTEMYNIILKLYGAIPRKDKQGFGISKDDKNTLVYVCEPDRPMMAKKAYDLAREVKVMDGNGYKRIVILAWDYEMGYDNDLNKIIPKKKDLPDIESKLIPPDVYRYLRSTKHGDADVSNKIVFYQKPYLKLSDPEIISETKDEVRIRIKLDRYVVPGNDFPIRDNDEEKVREKRKQIEDLLRKNFSYILDYWTIDWNYDGDVFRSNWQAIKERKSSEPVPIVAETSLKKGKKYSIAVRVVDIFGNDAFGIKEINLK